MEWRVKAGGGGDGKDANDKIIVTFEGWWSGE